MKILCDNNIGMANIIWHEKIYVDAKPDHSKTTLSSRGSDRHYRGHKTNEKNKTKQKYIYKFDILVKLIVFTYIVVNLLWLYIIANFYNFFLILIITEHYKKIGNL